MADPTQRGIDHASIELDLFRVFKSDEKKFLEKLKTYNNMDHDGGDFRAWNPLLNRIVRFIRPLLGLGNIPLTPSHPVATPGHVFILARSEDKKQDGEEMR